MPTPASCLPEVVETSNRAMSVRSNAPSAAVLLTKWVELSRPRRKRIPNSGKRSKRSGRRVSGSGQPGQPTLSHCPSDFVTLRTSLDAIRVTPLGGCANVRLPPATVAGQTRRSHLRAGFFRQHEDIGFRGYNASFSILFSAAALSSPHTSSYAANDQVRRGPVPDWVTPSELMPVPEDASGLMFVRRHDTLVHLDPDGQAQYLGFRIRILHPNALQWGTPLRRMEPCRRPAHCNRH